VKADATAGNVPLLELGGMVTELGTARLVEFELRLTVPPPVALRVTVQVVEAAGASVAGLHASELREGVPTETETATVPPVLVTATGPPMGDEPRLPATLTGKEILPNRVTERVATTPSEIALLFNPHATQV
jgi:hypothetical protein